ncbi:MAG: IS4 family transposase [Deltaproteobacteria bacterium]|nr:IS4 family transposase [Deltaproteobacteria bacterium]
MNRNHLNRFASAVKETLGWENLTARGRQSGHCRRLREVTPQRLVCALVEALGAQRVESVADCLRTLNAQTGLNIQYKPFHNRLVKPEFPRFMRQVFHDLLQNLSARVLRPAAGGKLAHFRDLVIQDGSSFAVHDALAQHFGGRFTAIRPAAVEIHTFLSVFQDQVIEAQVAPDKEAEQHFLPAPESLRGKLFLADRGYQNRAYWEKVQAAGGFFLVRGKRDLDPLLLKVRGPGGRLRRFEGRRLQEVVHVLPRRRLDLDVQWDRPGGETLRLRMVLLWNRPKKRYLVLVSNVSRRVLTAREVLQVYRLRWQIELLFKEWKSYANLHAFTSAKAPLVEGLIWASLCAAALKRGLAHASQRAGKAPISSRIVAMSGPHILPDLLQSALDGFRHLKVILERIFRYLATNARRAHPKRDGLRGRMQFGLEYIGFDS